MKSFKEDIETLKAAAERLGGGLFEDLKRRFAKEDDANSEPSTPEREGVEEDQR